MAKKKQETLSDHIRNLFMPINKKIKRPKPKEMDITFLVLVILLVCVGLVMLFSATAIKPSNFRSQFLFAIIGLFGMFVISRIDYKLYQPFTKIFMLLCVFLLMLVLIPKIGVEHQGARRWLKTGFEWQPSEFMKLAIAMFFAAKLENEKGNLKDLHTLTPYLGWIGITGLLLMLETHLSGTIIICGIAIIILLVAGMPFKYFFGAGAAMVPIGFVLLRADPIRFERILNFVDPFKDTQGVGYQVVQGLYAIATGGFFGLGLGESVQKYSYLPEPYNDFIFAVICEELGFFGAIVIMVLFSALIIRGIKIAVEAPDIFGTLVCAGIIAQIGIQTFFNIAVATSTLPNTGVSLPFFSSGGSSLVVLLCEMGIVLNISKYSRKGM